MIFGIDKNDNTTQPYLDERALAYIAQYMSNKGAFNSGDDIEVENASGSVATPADIPYMPFPISAIDGHIAKITGKESGRSFITDITSESGVYSFFEDSTGGNGAGLWVFFSKKPFSLKLKYSDTGDITGEGKGTLTEYNGYSFYTTVFGYWLSTITTNVPTYARIDNISVYTAVSAS